jgi:AraC-like DNA-binding protein
VFSEETGNLALDQSEPGLCAILDEHALKLLEELPPLGSLGDRVRDLLARQLSGGDTSAETTALSLKMSVRTLHRRLSAEGTSHKKLLEELRRKLAASYLRDGGLAISEITYLLGFSEPSAFHRAFRRWTGKTPMQFRATTP